MRDDVRIFLEKLQRTNFRGVLEPGERSPFEARLAELLKNEDDMWEVVNAATPDKILSDGAGVGYHALEAAEELGIDTGGHVSRTRFTRNMPDAARHNLVESIGEEQVGGLEKTIEAGQAVIIVTRGRKPGSFASNLGGSRGDLAMSVDPDTTVISGGQGGVDLMYADAARRGNFTTGGDVAWQRVAGKVTGHTPQGNPIYAKGDVVAFSPQYATPDARSGSKGLATAQHKDLGMKLNKTLDSDRVTRVGGETARRGVS